MIAKSSATTSYQYNYAAIKNEIDSANFNPILEKSDPSLAAELFVTMIQEITIKHSKCMTIQRRVRVIKPWMTQGLVRYIRTRDIMHKKVASNPHSNILRVTYKRYCNFLNSLLKKLKRTHDKNELRRANNNAKATWKAIKLITNTGSQPQSSKRLLQIAVDPQTSINEVNSFFVNIGQTLASNVSSHRRSPICNEKTLLPPCGHSLVILPVDEAQVERLIDSLRSDCATGYDNIPAKVLRQTKSILAAPITHICNRALESGIFPDAFKKAVVHPIFKSGD